MANPAIIRFLMPLAGLALIIAASLGLFACFTLLSMLDVQQSGRAIWINYGLVAIALLAALFAGLSLLWAWMTDRQRDVVPGPALYLFGIAVMMLGSEALIMGGYLAGFAGIVIGFAIIVLEYRSDWL